MIIKNDLNNIDEFLNKMRVITEANHTIPKDTFPVANKKTKSSSTKSNPFYPKNSGPENADGFRDNAIDPIKNKKKTDGVDTFSQKNESTRINTFMSKKFDNLFNDVMNDRLQLEQLAPETVEDVAELPELDDAGGDDEVADGGDDADMTPAEMLDKVMDLLGRVRDSIETTDGDGKLEMSDIDDDPENSDHSDKDIVLDDDDSKKTENEETYTMGEKTDMKEVKPTAHKALIGKNPKVSGTASKVSGGKAHNVADHNVSYNDGEPKKGADLTSKNNKVSGTVTAGRQLGH